ncbi:MAG: hypothetical protein PHE43_00610 [Candidatus Nanoarchaeia archaeon]|nr:hypothetical protein [Candidatus Nanoarchaeia archaeon]
MKKIIALMLIVIFLSSNIAIGAERTKTSVSRTVTSRTSTSGTVFNNLNFYENVGEAISVYADSYSPTVLTSNLLEQGDVPVFVTLKANTLGSFLGQTYSAGEPTIGIPSVNNIEISTKDSNEYIQSMTWIPPKSLTSGVTPITTLVGATEYSDLDNFGTLVITIAQIGGETEMPDEIEMNLTAKTYFGTNRTLTYGSQQLLLQEESNDDIWTSSSKTESGTLGNTLTKGWSKFKSWFGGSNAGVTSFAEGYDTKAQNSYLYGKAYFRAKKIEKDRATICVYDSLLRQIGSCTTLKVGETSSQRYKIDDYTSTSNFVVKLDNIYNGGQEKARLRVLTDSQSYDGYFGVNEQVFETGLKVKEISVGDTTEIGPFSFGKDYKVVLENPGNDDITIKADKESTFDYVTGDPCEGVNIKDLGENSDSLNYYCAAIDEFKSAINYESESENRDKYYTKIIDAYLGIFGGSTDTDVQNQALSRAIDQTENIVNENTLQNLQNKIIEYGSSSAPFEIVNIEGELISVRLLGGYSPKSQGITISLNGAYQKNLNLGSKIEGTPYYITDVDEEEIIISTNKLAAEETQELPIVNEKIRSFDSITNENQKVLNNPSFKITESIDETSLSTIIQNKKKYQEVAEKTNVPWELIAAIHYRESSLNFNTYLHNGEKLGTVTTKVPKGILFNDWVEAATDAIELGKEKASTITTDADVAQMAAFAELYNGPGYRSKGVPSAYTWSGTSNYESGFYIKDGEFSATAKDSRPGVVAIILAIKNRETGYVLPEYTKVDQETIKLGKTFIYSQGEGNNKKENKLTLEKIDVDKLIRVSVIPGRENVFSVSDFSVVIPIEKRSDLLTNYTTEELDEKIKSLNKTIESLNGIVNFFDTTTEKWKDMCGYTFAFITAKNFLFGSQAGARQAIMNGLGEVKGIKNYCLGASSQAGTQSKVKLTYDSYDDCIMENADLIDKAVDEYDKLTTQWNEEIKDFKGDITKTSYYTDIVKSLNIDNANLVVDSETLKEYMYLDAMSGGNTKLTENINSRKEEIEKAWTEKNVLVSELKETLNGQDIKDDQISSLAQNILSSKQETVYSDVITKLKTLDEFKDKKIIKVSSVAGTTVFLGYDENSLKSETTTQINVDKTYKDYSTLQGLGATTLYVTCNGACEFSNNKQEKSLPTNVEKIYYSTESANKELNKDYAASALAYYYPDGKPYCLPYKDGNYFKILEYYSTGEVKEFNLMNVGKNGLLCDSDDTYVTQYSELKLPQNSADLKKYMTSINKALASKCTSEGAQVTAEGKKYTCSYSKANQDINSAKGSCTDVMSPSDCKLLFNVCDPVMCPSSRFNLGGRWYVENVIGSGLTGSIFLPQGSGDVIPLCISGVSASMTYYQKILEGYKSCLIANRDQGKSIGICDKTKSVYFCKMAWGELKGIVSVLKEFIFGGGSLSLAEGGAEYFNFKDNLDNVGDSINAFVSEYGQVTDKNYQASVLTKIDEEVCNGVVSGSIPSIGDFMDRFTQTSKPAQFMGYISVEPYAAQYGASLYNVYFNIYAGANQTTISGQKGTYRVYMVNDYNEAYYVTFGNQNKCGDASKASISDNQYIDANINCIAKDGFNELCIEVNDNVQCGFGQVSSEYLINKIKDDSTASDALKEIDSAEECVPETTVGTTTLNSLNSLSPVSISATNSIKRICSTSDPNTGLKDVYWTVVGTCGKDSDGISLGSCWLDTRTFEIKDYENYQNVSAELSAKQKAYYTALNSNAGLSTTLSEEEKKLVSEGLGTITKEMGYDEKVKAYNELTTNYYSAEAHYQFGLFYLEMAKKTKTETTVTSTETAEEKSSTEKPNSCVVKEEVCDKIDNDCDNQIDEENVCVSSDASKILLISNNDDLDLSTFATVDPGIGLQLKIVNPGEFINNNYKKILFIIDANGITGDRFDVKEVDISAARESYSISLNYNELSAFAFTRPSEDLTKNVIVVRVYHGNYLLGNEDACYYETDHEEERCVSKNGEIYKETCLWIDSLVSANKKLSWYGWVNYGSCDTCSCSIINGKNKCDCE